MWLGIDVNVCFESGVTLVSRLIINSYAPLRFCYATQTKALVSTGGGCGSAVPHCQALAPRASHSTATVS